VDSKGSSGRQPGAAAAAVGVGQSQAGAAACGGRGRRVGMAAGGFFPEGAGPPMAAAAAGAEFNMQLQEPVDSSMSSSGASSR
jgi:hypothetical protein